MLVRIDQEVFLFLNSMNSPFWDQVMWAISGRIIWIPLYITIIYFLSKKLRRKMFILALVIALVVVLGNEFSVIIKNLVLRPRPCYEPALKGMVHIVNGKCGGQYGFVSSHATNAFSVALLSLLFIRVRWFSFGIIFWALLIGYSRIYLGVHYPGDVICGSLLGALTGWGGYKLFEIIDRRVLIKSQYFSG
jgi:undecaprenyl-diphosphatase